MLEVVVRAWLVTLGILAYALFLGFVLFLATSPIGKDES